MEYVWKDAVCLSGYTLDHFLFTKPRTSTNEEKGTGSETDRAHNKGAK